MKQCSIEIKRGQEKEFSKYNLTLLIVMFPSLLIAIVGVVVLNSFARLGLQVLLIGFQFVLLKNLLDELYMVDND